MLSKMKKDSQKDAKAQQNTYKRNQQRGLAENEDVQANLVGSDAVLSSQQHLDTALKQRNMVIRSMEADLQEAERLYVKSEKERLMREATVGTYGFKSHGREVSHTLKTKG